MEHSILPVKEVVPYSLVKPLSCPHTTISNLPCCLQITRLSRKAHSQLTASPCMTKLTGEKRELPSYPFPYLHSSQSPSIALTLLLLDPFPSHTLRRLLPMIPPPTRAISPLGTLFSLLNQ